MIDGAVTERVDSSATAPRDTGAIFLAGCEALPSPCAGNANPDCGKCQYRVVRGEACTAEAPCDDLLLYWSNFGCDAEDLSSFVTGLVGDHPDLVVACVQPMFPGELLPSSMGAPARDDRLVDAVFTRLRPGGDLGVWSGKNILTGGCSAGASRTPVVSARTTTDERWLGSAKNAACLSDGVVSVVEQDRFLGEGVALGGADCGGRHSRVVSAYTTGSPVAGHSCTASPGGQCACDPAHASRAYPGTCGDGDCLRHDTLVTRDGTGPFRFSDGLDASALAIKHWKFVVEGDGFTDSKDRCSKDVTPKAPFAGLCAAIDASSDHDCELVDRPSAPHCAAYASQFTNLCLDWFRAIP
ncbi:MAG: hypothetical protein U0169_09680 [Polyangiaceae bacterium]